MTFASFSKIPNIYHHTTLTAPYMSGTVVEHSDPHKLSQNQGHQFAVRPFRFDVIMFSGRSCKTKAAQMIREDAAVVHFVREAPLWRKFPKK
jgi:hypothetical protein